MKRTAFFTDERTFWHTGGTHALFFPVGGWVQPPSGAGYAESPDSKRRLLSLVHASGLAAQLDMRGAAPAAREDLLRIHPAGYLDAFRALSDANGGDLGDLAPFGKGSYEIAALSAGLAIAAVDAVVDERAANAFSLSRPPGHHCLRDRPMGFCLLANIPIAIEAARAKHGIGRVAVIDWDVHHGNGTQSIYYDDADTLTISLHQDRCFPPGYGGAEDRGAGAGIGANLNVPLLAGSGDDAYRHAFERIVLPALERFRPELIVVASGLDASAVDPLARMLLHTDSYRFMTRAVKEAAQRHCGGRLVMVHEGGYSEAYVPFCGLAIVEELAGVRTAVADPMLELAVAQQPGERFLAFQRTLIDELAASFGLPAAR
ncbi:class II histone deacetylase [Burkholderia multivorans]|uniref:class II histone deacetylase n=1 Tax=Burkholderia multivorans TaxID=87883 RepID=UPI0009E0E03F|nr:class II histone deacetylase [Burkholderia multivorans]MDN8081663.1 class II histone deacetylase [Burkholderia multivorans]SAK27608.1 histone deacetylase family protein [Burkholderia multivorans]SAK32609.1 histone deacetylase family protein [Burkholderia multivorans]